MSAQVNPISMTDGFGAARVPSVYYVADVARIRGVSLSATRAYMVRLEQRFGSAVIVRDGRRLTITPEALARVMAGKQEPGPTSEAIDTRFRRLRQQIRALSGDQHALRQLVIDHDATMQMLRDKVAALESRPGRQFVGK